MPVFEMIPVTDNEGLALCKAIRKKVFIDEQGVDESLEIDEYDMLGGRCRHYYTLVDGCPAAAFRCMDKGGGRVKLQRFCVLPEYRRQGVGQFMLNRLEEMCRRENITVIEMGAQCQAVPFYEACGYEVVSGIFMDAGIEHVKMEKQL